MKCEVISKVVFDSKLQGYILKPEGATKNIFMSVKMITYRLGRGTLLIPGVKLTSTGKLRGYDGLQLSKLPTAKLGDLATINAGLLEVLLYVYKQLIPKGDSNVKFSADVRDMFAYYNLDIRMEKYDTISNPKALEDLLLTLAQYKKSLPKDCQGLADDLYGQVGSNGHIRIIACKNLVQEGV